jgi:ubiquinone/menaquinone biosynthesis C-methylase UbiE
MSDKHDHKSLVEIHEDVPAEHYDKGIKRNLFQRYWHWRRFNEVEKIIQQVEGPVLDVGCHSGTFTKHIIKKIGSKEIYGVDISPSAIKLAKKRIPYGHFQVASGEKLPFKNNFFDAVFCLEVLEHVDYPQEVLNEVKRVLKKGGYAILLVPTDNKLFKIVWFLWTMMYPVWRHAHVQSFTNDNLESVAKKAGLKIQKVKTFNLGMLKLILLNS